VVGVLPEAMLRAHRHPQPAGGRPVRGLKGERFDAHDFLPQAHAQGAVAALAERGWPRPDCPAWKCPTPAWHWASWRRAWRDQFDMPLIAVTGSNGKTTVTQMMASHPARSLRAMRRWPRQAISTTTSGCR
jgi:UDP-N-acetylmuramoyl-tripeptide--D-alanyl-D-alanine ligase